MNAPVTEALAITPAKEVAGRVKALDCERVPNACCRDGHRWPTDGIIGAGRG
jgi:hypothetical protein